MPNRSIRFRREPVRIKNYTRVSETSHLEKGCDHAELSGVVEEKGLTEEPLKPSMYCNELIHGC